MVWLIKVCACSCDSWAPWVCWTWPVQSYGPLTEEPVPISENVAQVCGAVSHAFLIWRGLNITTEGWWLGLSQSWDSFWSVKSIDQWRAVPETDRWLVWLVLKVITMEIKVLEPLAGSSQLQTWTWPANPRTNRELRMTNPPLYSPSAEIIDIPIWGQSDIKWIRQKFEWNECTCCCQNMIFIGSRSSNCGVIPIPLHFLFSKTLK